MALQNWAKARRKPLATPYHNQLDLLDTMSCTGGEQGILGNQSDTMSYTGGEHGIMSAILALTSPPTFYNSDGSKGSKNDKSGSQKKANRAQVKEAICEGCGDIGEFVLTCIECSVAYHPVCDDPPLEEDFVKDIDWFCRSCRNKKTVEKEQKETKMPDLEKGDFFVSIENSGPPWADQEDSNNGDNSSNEEPAVVTRTMATLTNETNIREVKKLKAAFVTAVSKAKAMNPTTFEIPHSFQMNQYNFPGTSRSLVKKPGGIKLKPTIVDLEIYCVPRPLMLCFHCGKSCRAAPLLKCDYCPKFFHFDCLNPPLTTPPVGLWMCPLHPEPFLETKLLKTTQLSHRVKLWDLTHQQIDRNSVILKFLNKCSQKNPAFGRKVRVPSLLPHAVADDEGNLANPPQNDQHDADSIISFMDTEKLMQNMDTELKQKLYKCYEETISTPVTPFIQIQFNQRPLEPLLKDIVGEDDTTTDENVDQDINTKATTKRQKEQVATASKRKTEESDETSVLMEVEQETEEITSPPNFDFQVSEQIAANRKCEETDEPNTLMEVEDEIEEPTSSSKSDFQQESNWKVEDSDQNGLMEVKQEIEESSASPKDFQLAANLESNWKVEESDEPTLIEVKQEITAPLKSDFQLSAVDLLLHAAKTVEKQDPHRRMEFLKSMPVEQVYELALQKMADVDMHMHSPRRYYTPSCVPSALMHSSSSLSSGTKIAKQGIHFLIINAAKTVKCHGTSLVIGTGHNEDPSCTYLNPQTLFNCKRFSDHHAVVFFDRSQKQWEILNYSPYGITVDSVRFVLNPKEENDDEENSDLEAMKSQILQNRKILVAKTMNPRNLSFSDAYNQKIKCPCLEEESRFKMKIRNEGSAVLRVGTKIQIGCMKMVVRKTFTEEDDVSNHNPY